MSSSIEIPEIKLTGGDIFCPSHYNISCSDNTDSINRWNLYLGPIPTYISLVSCSLSCLGAISIILSYVFFSELRSGSRAIITFLSIADLITSIGYMTGDINYLVHSKVSETASCNTFETICSLQSYVTTWSQLSSYTWNSALAIYLFLSISFAKNRAANNMIPYCHVIAWGLPILVAFPLLLCGYLGFSLYSASNWCFVKDPHVSYDKRSLISENVMIPAIIARVVPEFLTYVIIIILYSVIKIFVYRMKRRLKEESRSSSGGLLHMSLNKIDNKLLLIPLAFVILRIWGFMQFFFILSVSKYFSRGCVSYPIHITHFVLGILEAIGEGGQGWANALLFIVFNAKTRKLIIASSLRMCFNRLPCFRCCFSCKCCVDMMYKQRRNALLEKLAQEEGGDNRSLLSDNSSIDGDDDYSASLREVSRDSTPSRLTVQYAD